MDDTLRQKIQTMLDEHPIVLFMKGTKTFPQCGFSAAAVEALKRAGATEFLDVNVLADPEIRQGIKEFGSWPTLPQVYVKGKLLGGSDILREMLEKGELAPLVQQALAK